METLRFAKKNKSNVQVRTTLVIMIDRHSLTIIREVNNDSYCLFVVNQNLSGKDGLIQLVYLPITIINIPSDLRI